jgi:hypothetical protein
MPINHVTIYDPERGGHYPPEPDPQPEPDETE